MAIEGVGMMASREVQEYRGMKTQQVTGSGVGAVGGMREARTRVGRSNGKSGRAGTVAVLRHGQIVLDFPYICCIEQALVI
jgi:hypothetical protein